MNWTQADQDRGPTRKQPGRTTRGAWPSAECGPTRSPTGGPRADEGQSRARGAELGTVPEFPSPHPSPGGRGSKKAAPFERLYRVGEVAELFGVSKDTVRDWLAQGVLRGGNLRKGGTVYVKESELARAMQRIGS